MSKQPESRLQLKIQKHLKQTVGGRWFKIHCGAFQEAGIPDLLGVVNGEYFGFEVKMPGEEPSKIQIETIKSIIEEGNGAATVVESKEEALEFVRTVRSLSGKSRYLYIREKNSRFIF